MTPDTERIGFHTKGYIFRRDETYTFIIGSSNMTGKALSVNKEWNTKMVSTAEGEMYKNIQSAFDALWDDKNHTSEYEEFIEEYRTEYQTIKKQRKLAAQASPVVSLEQYKLSPNSMQVDFINNLKRIREQGEDKALLISATGSYVIIVTKSGKAYKYLLSSLCPFSKIRFSRFLRDIFFNQLSVA